MKQYEVIAIKVNVNHRTDVAIVDIETGEVFAGYSQKSPNDEFDYTIGVELALSRALIKLNGARVKLLSA